MEDWTACPGTGKIWKEWMSIGWFALVILHCLYKNLRLLHVLIFVSGTPLHQIILHSVLAVDSMTVSVWYYIIYMEYADDFALFVRITLTGNVTGGTRMKNARSEIIPADWVTFF